MRASRVAWPYNGLMFVASIVLLFSLGVAIAYAVNLITFPFDYDQGEGFELVDTILFSQFQWPYQNTDSYPFYSSNYPPLFHILPAPFVWIFGPSYAYGRLLSFIATLLTAVVISYAVYRDTHQRWIALLSGLAYISSNFVYHNAPLFRQHLTMVLLETIAIVVLAQAFQKRENKLIALGLGLLIAAGYTKQLAAISAVAVLVWMFLRNPRRAVLWGAAFVAVGVAIFVVLTVATSGEWWRQTIIANVNAFNPFQMFGLALLWLRLHALLLIPAVLYTLYELYFSRLSLYAVWFGITAILGGIAAGTWGAGDSYYTSAIAAMCIVSGRVFGQVGNSPRLRQSAAKAVVVLIIPMAYLGYGVSTLKLPTEGPIFGPIASALSIEPNVMGRHFDSATYDVLGYANIGHFTTREDVRNGYRIVDLIQNADGPVISEDAAFSIVAGKDVITNPTQLRNLYLAGVWEGAELLKMIENDQFALIILRASFFPTPVLEAIQENYSPTKVITMNGFDYVFWSPANK